MTKGRTLEVENTTLKLASADIAIIVKVNGKN